MSFKAYRKSARSQNFLQSMVRYLCYRCTFTTPVLSYTTKIQLNDEKRARFTEFLCRDGESSLACPVYLPPSLLDSVPWLEVTSIRQAWLPDMDKLTRPVVAVYQVVSIDYGILSLTPLHLEMHITYTPKGKMFAGDLVYNPSGAGLSADDAER